MQFGYKVAGTAKKRSRNGRHKVAKYVNPVANSKYCADAGRMKLSFDSKEAAYRFIDYNKEVILRQRGYAPVRSYLCPICGCWHVTSRPSARVGKPQPPELQHDVHRMLHRMEHCVELAFKALALFDMKRAKSLCDEANRYYQCTLVVHGFEAMKRKLLARLNYCIDLWNHTRDEWMRRLCHVNYHPITLRYKQWYM